MITKYLFNFPEFEKIEKNISNLTKISRQFLGKKRLCGIAVFICLNIERCRDCRKKDKRAKEKNRFECKCCQLKTWNGP
jgi:hypothetical protein